MANRTGRWAAMSKAARFACDHCVVCFSTEDLVVHHLKYRGKRGTGEQPGDVAVLCWECHDMLHEGGRRSGHGPAVFDTFRDARRDALGMYQADWNQRGGPFPT